MPPPHQGQKQTIGKGVSKVQQHAGDRWFSPRWLSFDTLSLSYVQQQAFVNTNDYSFSVTK